MGLTGGIAGEGGRDFSSSSPEMLDVSVVSVGIAIVVSVCATRREAFGSVIENQLESTSMKRARSATKLIRMLGGSQWKRV